MIGLIIKDILFIKNSWKNLAITFISALILSVALNNYITVICIIPLMLITAGINAFQTDEFYLTESYSLTFPVSREMMVVSRYLFTILMAVISIFLGLIVYLLIYIILRPSSDALNIIMIGELLGIIFISMIMDFIFYPIIYKYGCEKSRYVITSIVMILFGLLTVIFNIVDISTIDINGIISFTIKYGLFISIFVFIVSMLVSYYLSVAFFKKNDY